MKRSLLFIAVLWLVLQIGMSGAFASGPKIQLDEEMFDFGTIKQGEEVTHEFIFNNKGDSDLVITDVKTSCGCTAAVTSSKTLAPGDSGTLKVTFNSKGRSGPQTKTATIVTNDSEKPRVVIRMTGKVDPGNQPIIKILPSSLDIGVVEPGGSMSNEVTITNTGTTDLVIESFVTRTKTLKASYQDRKDGKQTLKPNDSLKIDVVVTPGKTSGVYQGYLQIQNNSTQKIVTVPVYGYISDRYMLKPDK
jgi:hypothetical protein